MAQSSRPARSVAGATALALAILATNCSLSHGIDPPAARDDEGEPGIGVPPIGGPPTGAGGAAGDCEGAGGAGGAAGGLGGAQAGCFVR